MRMVVGVVLLPTSPVVPSLVLTVSVPPELIVTLGTTGGASGGLSWTSWPRPASRTRLPPATVMSPMRAVPAALAKAERKVQVPASALMRVMALLELGVQFWNSPLPAPVMRMMRWPAVAVVLRLVVVRLPASDSKFHWLPPLPVVMLAIVWLPVTLRMATLLAVGAARLRTVTALLSV